MAPDAPAAPQRQSSKPTSRRTSQIYPMSPPPLPLASPTSNQPHSTTAFPPLGLHTMNPVDSTTAGVPMRHPRPLTAAELHLELEKEQEAVVNRLTRELSALRAHSASVASTTSSTTSGVPLDNDITSPAAATSARRHRSSSSISRTSMGAHAGPPSFSTGVPVTTPNAGGVGMHVVSSPRYEEVAMYRAELEEAKRENEGLRRRIRELEGLIRGGGATQGERGRSGAPEPTTAKDDGRGGAGSS